MTVKEIAEKLNNNDIDVGLVLTGVELLRLGVVVAYGQSDDLLQLRGAIADELGAYEGTEIKLNNKGIVKNLCDEEDCPYFLKEESEARFFIKSEYDPASIDATWLITSNIPHETFDLMSEDELFCRGIVFLLGDLQNETV